MRKTIILSIAAAGLLFGSFAVGCRSNSRKNTAMRSVPADSSFRPAEVLSASAYRPPRLLPIPAAPQRTVPVVQPAPILPPDLAVARAATPRPAHPAIQPLAIQPANPGVLYAYAPIPELEPKRVYAYSAARAHSRPVAEVMISRRPAAVPAMTRPVQYQPTANRDEIRKALAPLTIASAAPAQSGRNVKWTPSPVSAMRDSPAGQY